jgi:hypothetical protein
MMNRKLKLMLQPPIEVWQLPPFVPRGLAAAFSLYSSRTLKRAENKPNGLIPIRRGHQRIFYERTQFLKWLGFVEPPEPAPAPVSPTPTEPSRRRPPRKANKAKSSKVLVK